ncbi:cytochrome b [Haliangium sp.]|uniref:cytochrome b n=1 Tax=Haliangium sp. TaxID=2663208 RepID=UPI003D1112DF
MGRIAAWFQERLPIDGAQLREMTNEPVPGHLKRWWFCLGGTPAYLFVVQVVTGVLLSFYYQPSPDTAYQSVHYITHEASFGWYVRSMHQWSATFMVAAVVLHQMRVFFTGAYRKPREINWIVGMFLLLCTVMLGFTGYSLVYEQLSYWGATVGANIADSVPWIGAGLKTMLLGGESYNQYTLSRFFVLHAAVLPALMVVLIIVHIAIVRIQGVTEYEFDEQKASGDKETFSFFPDHLYTELIIGLALMIVLSALATLVPATLGPQADPLTTPEVIKPEWYFYVAFRWLKLFTGTAAVLSMGLIVFAMFLWPFIDKLLRRITRIPTISVWIGIVAVGVLIALTIWEAAVAH